MPFSPIPAVAQAEPDWCTSSPETYTVMGQRIVFSPACRGHDICYFTIGSNKDNCDLDFRNNLRNICDQALQAVRQRCYYRAGIYSNAVSGSGNVGIFTRVIAEESHKDAQSEARSVRQSLINRFGSLKPDYNKTIAWELARRQASRESVLESKQNTVDTIAIVLASPYILSVKNPDGSKYGNGNCFISFVSFKQETALDFICDINSTRWKAVTTLEDGGILKLYFYGSPDILITAKLKKSSFTGTWIAEGISGKGSIEFIPTR